jgi:hypothetical protein
MYLLLNLGAEGSIHLYGRIARSPGFSVEDEGG